ncbi:DctP family TRAP transporter solute-binding subunit [Georgenia sp.]
MAIRLTSPRTTRIRRTTLAGGIGLALATVLASCAGGENVDTVGPGATAGADDTIFRFAHVYDAQHPVETCGVTAIQESLAGSGINIESYPSAQLGSEAELLEQIAAGAIDIAVAGPSFLGVWYEDAAVLDGAYLFEDVDQFAETVQSDAIAKIYDRLYEESGIKVMSTWYYGTRQVTSNVPISTPEDLQGIKIRTPDAPLYLVNIGAMGGTATPMALDEVYTALQQGTLDAQENPVPTIESSKFFEVQKYINLTAHMVQAVNIVTHDGVLDSLSDDERSRFDEAMQAGADATRACIQEQEVDTIERWKEDGTVIVNEDVDREAFAERVREQLPSQVPWGDLYLEIQGKK